jgi:hypothetical protein
VHVGRAVNIRDIIVSSWMRCAENSSIINITNNNNNYNNLYTDAVTNIADTQKLRTTNNKCNQYQLTSPKPITYGTFNDDGDDDNNNNNDVCARPVRAS